MNLHENINRIQSLLTENREEMIKNMISKHGLYHTITLMGGYERILNTIGHEYFTNDDKIEHFNEGFVTIDVYGEDNFSVNIGAYTEKYETLSDETLDNVFIFMIDALEDNM